MLRLIRFVMTSAFYCLWKKKNQYTGSWLSNKCIIFVLYLSCHVFLLMDISFFLPVGGAVMFPQLQSLFLLPVSSIRVMQASSPGSVRVCSAAFLKPPAGMRLRSALKSGEDTEVVWGHRGQVKSAHKTLMVVALCCGPAATWRSTTSGCEICSEGSPLRPTTSGCGSTRRMAHMWKVRQGL